MDFFEGKASSAQNRVGSLKIPQAWEEPKEQPIKPIKTSSKPKEKPSSLCKTPPATIKSRNNGAKYHRGGFLGEGGFARCFQIEDEKGRIYAAKTVAKASLSSTKTRAKLLGEIKVHQSMDHPNIVKFVECFEDDVNVYILLEMCSNKTLMDMHRRRKRFTEPEARFFLIQILGAVKYMHSKKVIHRDLKLGNIFLDQNMNVKIGDFGLAALLLSDSDRKKTICGTPNYIAPEVLFGKEDGHSFEVDLWSVGIILYAMLIGRPPFQSKEVNLIYKKIKAIEYQFPEDVTISLQAKDLIQSLLNKDPRARPTLDQIADHPFFHGEMPSRIPVTCLEGIPHWKNLTAQVSSRNYLQVSRAAGIGPGSGDGSTISKGAGNPTTTSRAKNGAKILPECLSPKVSTTNLRQIVSNVAAEYQTDHKEKQGSTRMTLRSRMKQPLSDLPINLKSASTALTNVGSDSHGSEPLVSLRQAIDLISNGLDGRLISNPNDTPKVNLFISQWVDYSNKYGLGYQLSDGSSGVYFNDSTTIVMASNEKVFDYIINTSNRSIVERQRYTVDSYPMELSKKLYLVRHFRAYMIEHLYLGESNNAPPIDSSSYVSSKNMPYMTDYLRTKQAIMFRMSNGDIQFNFVDHYKIVLSARTHAIKYIDKTRKERNVSLAEYIAHSRSTAQAANIQTGIANLNITESGNKYDANAEGITTSISAITIGEYNLQRLRFIKITLSSWYNKIIQQQQLQHQIEK
ncbi:kinase-like domain-containing protein [Dipodascopsis uninucleata]